MVRAQILFTPDLYEELKLAAQQRRESISSIVREAVKKDIRSQQKKGKNILELLAKHAVSCPSAPRDLSTNDSYLYGPDAP